MSEVKVNKISPRSGTTVTLGDSGDTFTIPAGATINNQGTATNFGATGSASWTTTVKTSGFTAVAGEGYFVDTTSGAISVNLPAGTAGAVVAFADYAKNFGTHNLTLVQNGSDKIGGLTINAKLNTNGIAVTLIFIDSTKGWIVTDDGLSTSANTAEFLTATGGTITTVCTNFKVHTFTGPGTFCVSAAGNSCGSNSVDYMVVAGGAAGGNAKAGTNGNAGGGGAGGYRESPGSVSCYTASPLGVSPAAAITVTAQGYPIVVGAGGASRSTEDSPPCGPGFGAPGNVSSALGISSAGGGGGGRDTGDNGGSGGGASGTSPFGSGNTPPVTPPQGNNGGAATGSGACTVAAGGGGAGAVGGNANPGGPAGNGGAGVASSINGTPTTRAGGGGGGGNSGQTGGGSGGSGGGGAGGTYNGGSGPGVNGTAGTTNTGGGGGATASANDASPVVSGAGGSGIVIIRYKFQ